MEGLFHNTTRQQPCFLQLIHLQATTKLGKFGLTMLDMSVPQLINGGEEEVALEIDADRDHVAVGDVALDHAVVLADPVPGRDPDHPIGN